MTSQAIPVFSFDKVVDRLLAANYPYQKNYYAMYSSWYGGIVTDPQLMMIPVDDHLVHRGDGIFEAFKSVGGKIYNLKKHLDRLEYSARTSFLTLPVDRATLVDIITSTVRAGGVPEALVKLLVSRGPGGHAANPYECIGSQVYVIAMKLKLPADEKYERGVKLITSHVPVKPSYFANVKSCNYLPNALMKKESEDAGADFPVSVDERGFLGEGATENIAIVTRDGRFLTPRFDRILRGTTVTRFMELAQALVASGELKQVAEADITPKEACDAAEVMMFGTTFDVLPVVDFDGRPIGGGTPGPFSRRFLGLIQEDMRSGAEVLTPVGL